MYYNLVIYVCVITFAAILHIVNELHYEKYMRSVCGYTLVFVDLSRDRYHYNYAIMSSMAYQISSLTSVYLTVYSGADQRKHQSSASLAFVRGIHRWPVNSPHKGPVTRKMFPFDDVIMMYPHYSV